MGLHCDDMMIVIADDDKVGTDLLILLAGQETS
jgi:hypothetical protein